MVRPVAISIGNSSPRGKRARDDGGLAERPVSSRRRFIAKGKFAEAERLYTELTNKEPSSPYAYSALASCRAMRGDYAGARQLYKQALRIEPALVDALFGLRSCDYAEIDYTNAVANYKTALAPDETCPEAHWGLAITYACSGRPTEAKIHLDRLRQLVPDSPHIAEIERATKRSLAELFGGVDRGGRHLFADSCAWCPPPSLILALGIFHMNPRLSFTNRIDAWAFRFVVLLVALISFEGLFHIAPADELLVQVFIALVLGSVDLYRYANRLQDR